MCGHCKAEDTSVCEECGVLVADGYQPIHRRQHPHPYDGYASTPERPGCVLCQLPEDASVHAGMGSAEVLGRARPDRPEGW